MPRLAGSKVLLSAAFLTLCIFGFSKDGRADSVNVAGQVTEGSSPSDICSSGTGSISCNASGSLVAAGTVSASAFASLSTDTMGTSVVASGFEDSYQYDYAQARATSVMTHTTFICRPPWTATHCCSTYPHQGQTYRVAREFAVPTRCRLSLTRRSFMSILLVVTARL